jgi:GNAT superfamily N-acetyltransferase
MIRRLTSTDLPALMDLSAAAGWNQTAEDWNRFLRLAPEGSLGIEADGRIVSTCTLLCYGAELAWLGMVLTHPAYRRRGFARQLVEAVLRVGQEKGLTTIKLDASDEGFPLYESLGFVQEQVVERWAGRPGVTQARELCARDHSLPLDLDREAFGVDRAFLLRDLAETNPPFLSNGGYAMTRPGARAMYLGPCIAETRDTARQLVEKCFAAQTPQEWFWDLIPSNGAAVSLATEYGFSAVRKLTRMVKGQLGRGRESLIYAAGGFEIG